MKSYHHRRWVFMVAVLAVLLSAANDTSATEPTVHAAIEGGYRLVHRWAHQPTVVTLPSGGYRMYVADRYRDSGSTLYPIIINSAVSVDGLAWSIEGGIRIGSSDYHERYYPGATFRRQDGTWTMYFSFEQDQSPRGYIAAAESLDGIHWTWMPHDVRMPFGGTYDRDYAYQPDIVPLPDGMLRMYYTGHDGSAWRIVSAVSSDQGATWSREPGVRVNVGSTGDLDRSGVYRPVVLSLGANGYVMFYTGFGAPDGRILWAWSTDGLNWEKSNQVVVDASMLPGGVATWYVGVMAGSAVPVGDNQYRLYFSADRLWNDFLNRMAIFSAIITITPPQNEDVTAPVIVVCPEHRTLIADDAGQVLTPDLTGEVVATDDVGVVSIAQSPEPDTLLGCGLHTVTITVADAAGNTARCEVLLNVIDGTAPTILSTDATPAVLWPPNGRMVTVNVAAEVWDACDPEPSFRIVSVYCNESALAPGSGKREPDWQILDDTRVALRAERTGSGSGRIYTICFEAADASGNTATGSCVVTVPHDKRR